MKSKGKTISRQHCFHRLIAETLEGRRLFSVSPTLTVALDSIVTLQPAAMHADHLAAAPDGSLWYASGETIERVASTGQTTAYTPAGGTNSGTWSVDSNIVFTSDNSAWFVLSNGQTDQLSQLATSGAFTNISTLTGAPSHYLTVAHDAVWATQGTSAIGEYSAAGSILVKHVSAASSLTGLTTDSTGEVWFTALTGPTAGLLGSINTAGQMQTKTIAGQPHGIAAGADGTLYFADSHSLWMMDSHGTLTQTALGTLSPADLAPAPDGSVWFIDQSDAGHPLWNLASDGSLHKTAIASAPPITSLAIGNDGALHFTAASDQSADLAADLGTVQNVGLTAVTFMTGSALNANIAFVGNNSFTVKIGGAVASGSISAGVLTLQTSGGASVATNVSSSTVTIQVDDVSSPQQEAQVSPAAPSEPSLTQRPADNPAPAPPNDPGNFDGEFTIQPATPSAPAPLPPEAPRPAHPSGDSYESRGNSAPSTFVASAPSTPTPLARPIHTHAPSHRDPRVAAALFSSSAAMLTAALSDGPDQANSETLSSPAVSGDSLAARLSGSRSSTLLPIPSEAPLASAGMADPVSQWWKWTSYVAIAPSLFDRRRAPITRIHW